MSQVTLKNGSVVSTRPSSKGLDFQAFTYALDLDQDQVATFRRECGARRVAFNWALAVLSEVTGGNPAVEPPDVPALLLEWRVARTTVCRDQASGREWWQEISGEAFFDGIRAARDGVVRWRRSVTGNYAGRSLGFPRHRKRMARHRRCTYAATDIRLERGRRFINLPVLGRCRSHENTRSLERLVRSGRARIHAVTLRQSGHRVCAVFRVSVKRLPPSGVEFPDVVVGVDLGVRWLATVATSDGKVVDRIANPRPLENALTEIRRLNRQLSRREPGSRRYRESKLRLAALHAKVAAKRQDTMHKLTRRLARTYGTIVIESLGIDSMTRRTTTSGRTLRRALSDSSLSLLGRHLNYKCSWYGSRLIVASRYFPSSRICHSCGLLNDSVADEYWTCRSCRKTHQRDENAAINLARIAGSKPMKRLHDEEEA